ncbi:MAG TPA: cytochrome c oxidase assembly protein [Terriglobales bacterium]|nr:cytochrome c oxidase assembly protein [Terriglobales bacterium]
MRLTGLSYLVFAMPGSESSAVSLSSSWDPLIVLSLLLMLGLYVLGTGRALAATRRNVSNHQAAMFLFGWLALIVALLSPVHALSESLFSAHMLQHELLMVVAAPLIVAGRPDLIYFWALPMQWRKRLGRFQHGPRISLLWRLITAPITAWLLHGIALWIWHIPALFDATILHGWIHAAQHASFLGTALLFWGTLLYGHLGKRSYGAGIVYVFTTAIHTSILGALLTFATSPWYSIYQHTAAFWGISPLEDQQLGGLIMWVPAGVTYIVVGLCLFAGWIRESDRRSAFGSVQAIIER